MFRVQTEETTWGWESLCLSCWDGNLLPSCLTCLKPPALCVRLCAGVLAMPTNSGPPLTAWYDSLLRSLKPLLNCCMLLAIWLGMTGAETQHAGVGWGVHNLGDLPSGVQSHEMSPPSSFFPLERLPLIQNSGISFLFLGKSCPVPGRAPHRAAGIEQEKSPEWLRPSPQQAWLGDISKSSKGDWHLHAWAVVKE